MLFSASADGSVFLFSVAEERINLDTSFAADDVLFEQPKIMDSELS